MALKQIGQFLILVLGAWLTTNGALAADINVGVVNIARIMEEAPQAEAARTKLEREFGPREREMVATQKQIRELEEKLGRDSAIMSESERRKLERDIMARKRDAQRAQDEYRDDLNFQRNEILDRLQREMADAIRVFAKDKGYDLILADAVYMSEGVDITSQVLDHLKREYKKRASK